MRHTRVAFALLVVLVAASRLAPPVRADTGTALGDRSGEGSTPFTGLAQAPEANLFTGALNTAIPIAVPPGRRGMTPQLALQYTSSAGPGMFGFGWDVPIGRIERSTTWGTPRCSGAHTDDFILVLPTGASQLVREAAGSTYYRPSVEQAYVRAQQFAAQNYWIVYDRSGLKYTFGDTDSARLGNSTPLTFLSPAADGTCQLTTAWALTRIEDPNGNTIDVAWGKLFNVLYPVTVRYGGSAQAGGPPHTYTLRFLPEWRPPGDRQISYRDGVAVRLVWRIYAIVVETDVPAPGTPVRTYGLQYRDDASGADADGYQSMLSAVSATGRPTQHFVYTPSVTGHRSTTATVAAPPGVYGELRVANDSQEVSQTLLDMDGDGLIDLVRSDTPPASSWEVHWGAVGSDGAFAFQAAATPWQVPGNWTYLRNVAVSSGGCNGNGWSCSKTDTFDLTGDGIPDYVDASNGANWIVYKGRGVPQWGFAPGVNWPAPNRQYIRRTYGGATYQDVVDMNGDGLPDLVVSGAPGQSAPYQWDVYLNTGSGFELTRLPAFPASENTLVVHVQDGLRNELLDFNGDGLPDIVKSELAFDARCQPSATQLASCLEVSFNNGQGFDHAALIPVPANGWVQHVTGTVDDNGVVQDLFDINGDGLPDWVYRRYNFTPQGYDPEWRVLLNLGGTLEPLTYVPSLGNPGYTDGIPARVWSGTEGLFRRNLRTNSRADLVDVNGDGFLDQIAAGGATWTVRLHAARERPNLLGLMENGLGGTNTIVYRPSTAYDNSGGDAQPDLPFINWVVDKTRQNDGQCTPPLGADVFQPGPPPAANPCIDAGNELVAAFLYQDGRFDPQAREFRGFRRVSRTTVEGTGNPGNQTVTYFGQEHATNGRILEVDTYAGGAALVRSEINLWKTRSAGTNRTQLWLAANQRVQWDLLTSGSPQFVATNSDPPDPYGNITHHFSGGLFGVPRIDTYTTYAGPQSGTLVYDRPSNVRVTDASGVLGEKWFYYDGSGADGLPLGAVARGNLKRVRARLTPSDPNGPQTRMAYDAYGNLIAATDPNARVTTTAYDSRALYPLTVTNAAGHTTNTQIDYRWGQPTSVTEPTGAVTRFDYDNAGRRTCVARPGDSLTACSTTYAYHFATAPGTLSWVEAGERQEAPHPPLTTRQYFDAIGRARYTDTFRVVVGAPTTVRSNSVAYDPGGRVTTLYHPYLASSATPDNGATSYDYHLNGSPYLDPLGRVYRTINADGTERRTEYLAVLTRSFDEAGERTESIADAFGRVVTQTVYSGVTPYVTTNRTYDGLGRLRTLVQGGVVMRSLTYDSLGRKTQMVDADSGTWRYRYDGAGNLLWQDDPRAGHHTEFCYDAINRPTRRCTYPNDSQGLASCTSAAACSDPDAALYHYDEASVPYARGRLTGVDDGSGSTHIDEYDQRGRHRRLTKHVELADGSRHARFAFTYDTNDRIASTTYPDGEIVFTEYDDAGQPIALRNQTNAFYVTDALYDVFGRPTQVDHVNGVSDTRTYGTAATLHRLQRLAATKGATSHLDLFYLHYTERGLLSQLIDLRNPIGELTNSGAFIYDAVGRVTDYDSTFNSLDSPFGYDSKGNLTRRGDRYLHYDNAARPHQATTLHIGSPTAPGQAVVHDANGNRTAKGSQAYTYDSSDRLNHIAVGSDDVDFVYDYSGQRVAKIVTAGGTTTTTRSYSPLAETSAGILTKWYFLGPLRVASQSTSVVGWETAALDAPSVWLAAAQLDHPALVVVLARQAGWMAGATLLCVVAGLLMAPWRRRPVVGIRVRPGHAILVAIACAVGTLPWPIAFQPDIASAVGSGGTGVRHYHVDHLGSTQVVTDAAGAIVEQVRYLPYGTVRGHWDKNNLRIANPGDGNRREFNAFVSEPMSGLQYAGARFYDPEVGTFLTHDSASQFSSPYSFGGGDPVNWTDPTGNEFLTGFLIAVAVSAAVSAAINTIIAAAQGLPLRAIGKAALGGAIAGAVGVGLGVVASAAAMGAASAAGTLASNVTLSEAISALGEVAQRAAFSTTIANTVGQISAAAGAPSEVTTAVAMITGLFASVGFDQTFFNPSGNLAYIEGKTTVGLCSTSGDHADITLAAAQDAGFNYSESTAILNANLARDSVDKLLSNQDHFDLGAKQAFNTFAKGAEGLMNAQSDAGHAEFLSQLGSATHHLQDQYALGHILPGTSMFKDFWGAPARFIIHNVIGGEVTFRQASYEATRDFLEFMHPASA